MKLSYMKSLCEISVIEMPHVNIMKQILNQGHAAFEVASSDIAV